MIRLLFGKPADKRPSPGQPPSYVLSDEPTPPSAARAKFSSLRRALLDGAPGVSLYRQDFLDECVREADELRVRQQPSSDNWGAQIVEDCSRLKVVRDNVVDWILLEAAASPDTLADALVDFLERLLELKSRPPEVTRWNDNWFEAHAVFAYETFLYIVAALLKTRAFSVLHELFTSHYLLPEHVSGEDRFANFSGFYGYSESLQSVLADEGRRLHSPAAELVKRQADRSDLPFESVMESELLVLLMAFLNPKASWYPQTLHYARHGRAFPFFVRAAQHKNFRNLATVTGIDDADALRVAVKEAHAREEVERWNKFWFDRTFWAAMNMDALDTLK